MRDKQTFQGWVEKLKSHDPGIRRMYVEIVGRSGHPAALEHVLRMLDDPASGVRYEAIKMLEYLGDDNAIPQLQFLLNDRGETFGGERVSEAAQKAITQLEFDRFNRHG
jgi:HEAT repeat protein